MPKSFFGRSLFTVKHRKNLLKIFQQDLDPSYAHIEAQLCSSKDKRATAHARFKTFFALAFLNGDKTQKYLTWWTLAIFQSLGPIFVQRAWSKQKKWVKTWFFIVLLLSHFLVTGAFIWSLLMMPGHSWQHLVTPRNTIFAYFWSLLATPGHKMQDIVAKCFQVALLSKNLCLVTHCNIWWHQLSSGHIYRVFHS